MKNYGFVQPVLESDHYIFGSYSSLPKVVLQPDGQWDAFLPVYEPQADKYETYGCTVWGTENALEALEKRITGIETNYDERFLYNLVPVNPPGSDPQSVSEAIRKNGLIPNRPLPSTYEEFCKPRPPTELVEARKWLDRWVYGHEWVFSNVDKVTRTSLMKQALQYSILGVSVTAWFEEDGVYVDNGIPNNHWCVVYGYYDKIVTVDGKSTTETFWKVFDSYDHSTKILHPNHNIQFCKRYSLMENKKKDTWLVALIKSVLGLSKPVQTVPDMPSQPVVKPAVKSPRQILYETAVSCLGTDASPNDIAPDEFGCAESINDIHFKAFGEYIETPGISTTKLFGAMVDQPNKFARVLEAEAGNIIISPTGFSNDPNTPIKNGHVGIFGKNNVIMSNSSETGKFSENYTLETWIARYRKRGGYPIYYFKRI